MTLNVDVWRLEFELHREAVTSLKLAPESDAEDTDADIEAELSAEELPMSARCPSCSPTWMRSSSISPITGCGW